MSSENTFTLGEMEKEGVGAAEPGGPTAAEVPAADEAFLALARNAALLFHLTKYSTTTFCRHSAPGEVARPGFSSVAQR
jgi:hypothetical protein